MEGAGIVRKLRETGGMHRPELDGNKQKEAEHTGNYLSYKVWARLTPTLTHVVTYELVTSGAEDDAMSFTLVRVNADPIMLNLGLGCLLSPSTYHGCNRDYTYSRCVLAHAHTSCHMTG